MMGRPHKCTQCPRMVTSSRFRTCQPCRKSHSAHVRRDYQEIREEGRCGSCRKAPALDDLSRCAECHAKFIEYWRVMREEAAREGRCKQCRKRPTNGLRTRCDRCAKSESVAKRKARRYRPPAPEAIRYALRLSPGLSLIELAGEAGISTRTVLRVLPKMPDVQCVERVWNKKIYRRVA